MTTDPRNIDSTSSTGRTSQFVCEQQRMTFPIHDQVHLWELQIQKTTKPPRFQSFRLRKSKTSLYQFSSTASHFGPQLFMVPQLRRLYPYYIKSSPTAWLSALSYISAERKKAWTFNLRSCGVKEFEITRIFLSDVSQT